MSDEDMRLVVLEQKLDSHIDDYHQHVEEEDNRWKHLITITEANSKHIEELAVSTAAIAASTKDVVELYSNAQAVVKVGSALGRLGKWLAGLAFLGAGFKWLAENL